MNSNFDIPPEELELIERYISKDMSDEAYHIFTERLQTDRVLSEKLRSVRLLLLGVQEAKLHNRVIHFHNDAVASGRFKKESHHKVLSIRQWVAAASVIVLAVIGALLFFSQSVNINRKLFAAYYKPDPGLISPMSSTDHYSFDRAMIDYKTGAYKKAIAAWEGLLKEERMNDTLNYFLGSAYLAMENPAKAIDYFRIVTSQPESYFFKDACWYTGLALLRIDEKQQAIPFLRESDRSNKGALVSKLEEQ